MAIDKARTSLKRDVLFEQLEVFAATVDLENKPKSRIVLKTTKTVYIVSVNDILWCSAEGSYTVFHLKGDQKILTSKHLKEYAKLLSNNTFFRIHKSILVNLQNVERYENTEASIIMKGDARLPVATRNKDEFLTAISTL